MSLQRGPVVYCAEFPDNRDGHILNLLFSKNSLTNASFKPGLLNGVQVVSTSAVGLTKDKNEQLIEGEAGSAILIPYYAWSNRGPGEMMVWLPVNTENARPLPLPTLASQSRVSCSKPANSLSAVNDQIEPSNSGDESWGFYHFWPDTNRWEWIQYDFAVPAIVSHARVYWFDDGPNGGCRIPDTWELVYNDKGTWKPVRSKASYKVSRDAWDSVSFEPVNTSALRLRIKLNSHFSSGVHEWAVE
jgi:uncharacterized protein